MSSTRLRAPTRLSSLLLCCLLLVAGTLPAAEQPKKPAAEQPKKNDDPWEGMNRKVYAFNEVFDRYAFKPVAKGYKKITPRWLNDTITRVFENVHDLRSSLNNVLQWEWGHAGSNFSRFLVNSTMGVGGMFDVASNVHLKKYPDDLGSTFAKWGVGQGPYLVLPFLGPSTVRDTAAIWPEQYMRGYHYIDHDLTRYSVVALYAVDTRADLLDLEKAVVGDRYTFIRDYYLQSRRMAAGQAPPPDDFGDDAGDGGWGDAPAGGDDSGW